MITQTPRPKNLPEAFLAYVELVYHCIVRSIRKSSGSASLGLLTEIMQTVMLVGMFYVMFALIGIRTMPFRGDFLLFLITGVFLFLLHNKAIGSVLSADGATSAMMKHAPMSTAISIVSSALAAMYLQTLAIVLILLAVHVLRGGLDIYDWSGLIAPFLLAWSSGIGVGLIFMTVRPLAPRVIQILSQIYRRANMITSGKMFAANALPSAAIPFLDWNPLFHCIDQARGAAFVNYFPRHTDLWYPLWFTLGGLVIGMMGEHWLRRNQSLSWSAR